MGLSRAVALLGALSLVGCASVQQGAVPAPEVASPPDFMARAQEHIAAREYWASPTRDGLQAPNRKHDLRSFFEPTGVRVHERSAGGSPRLVELRLAAVGRGDALGAVPPGEVSHHEGRVEIRRPGLVEWYENSAKGLEQGFTLSERPEPAEPGEVILDLVVKDAKASRRGPGAAIATETGRKLAYGKLVVTDALGKTLAARMKVPSSDRIQLVVADADAVYPIVVDPLLEGTADTQLASDQVDAAAGYGLSSAGDVNGDGYADVVVGAHGYDDGQTDEGAVFLFLGGPGGIADGGPGDADVVLTGQQANASFGYSVASAGDVNDDGYDDVIVGARFYDAGQTDEGAAFVFHGDALGLDGTDPASAATQLETNQAAAEIRSVAGAGDVNGDGYDDVIVGSPLYDAGQTDEGAAFVFHGSATGVADANPGTAPTQIEANQVEAVLGGSVSGAGDVNADGYDDVIVGAELYNVTFPDAGVAAVFLGGPSGIPDGSPSTASGGIEGNQADAWMGFAVASAGDVNGDGYSDVMASAARYDDGETDEGFVAILFGSDEGIAAEQTPSTADDGIESDQALAYMGERLGALGDVNADGYADIAVGAHRYSDGESNEGCLWVFYGGPDGVAPGVSVEAPSTADIGLCSDQAGAEFGANATGAGDVDGDGFADLLVGAHQFDDGESNEGAAFVYRGGADGIADGTPASATAQLESDQGNARMGFSVASAGDVNGDGFADVIVGANLYDAGQTNEGAAFVFLGSASGVVDGTPATAHAQLESDQSGAQMGLSVASAGDVNGDGYADVIVGAHLYGAGEGAAFVFLGSASGVADATPATAHAQLEPDQGSAQMGVSVASAGDVNGDGFADVIVGAYLYDAGQTDEGAAFVFLGSASGVADATPATAHAQLESDQDIAFMGFSVASAGDVNGDGFADVIVGAYLYDAGQTDEGAAFVFLGSPTGIADATPATAHAQLESDQGNAQMGVSAGSAGDVDGDGFADVIAGAHLYDAGQTDEGAAFVFLGSAFGVADATPATAHAQLESDQGSALIGISVASAADVNGDGFADVIVGAAQLDAGQTDEGAAFVFLGSASGVADATPATAHAQLELDQASGLMGRSVASAGDVNGDGFADVIVGAHLYDAGQTDEGAAFVFLGNSEGRPVRARQRHAYGAPDVTQPWGDGRGDAFRAELRGSHPAGVGRVRAEVEACPEGVPFGDAGCSTALGASWQLLVGGTEDALLTATPTGLAPGTLYRWRARVQYADATGTPPPNPAHGPWRRLDAQAVEADIRVVPEPGQMVLLVSGLAGLLGLHRWRERKRGA